MEVQVTPTEVIYRDEAGKTHTVRWADITSIAILTNDQGPFAEDVFWHLAWSGGSLLIPQMAQGSDDLLARAQTLPGFDNDAVIAAMMSTANQVFFCWEAPGAPSA